MSSFGYPRGVAAAVLGGALFAALAPCAVGSDEAMGKKTAADLELPLPDGVVARLGSTRFRAPGSIDHIALSAGEKWLVGSSAGMVYRYDARTGQPQGVSPSLGGNVNRIVMLEGDRIFAGVFDHGYVILNDKLEIVARGLGEKGPSLVVPIHGGGHAVVDELSKNLQILDGSGKEIAAHSVDGVATYTDVASSADGKFVFAIANEREQRHLFHLRIFVLSTLSGEVVAAGRLPEIGGLEVAVAPDGAHALVGGARGSVHLFDVASQSFTAAATVHEGRTTAVAWSSDGTLCASSSNGGNIVFYDGATLETQGAIPAHRGSIESLLFAADGARVYSCGQDGHVRVFDPRTGVDLLPSGGHEGPVFALAWLRDGSGILTGSQDGRVILWGRDGEPIRSFFGNAGAVDAIATNRNGDLAAFSGRDGSTLIVDLLGGETRFKLQVASEAARDVAFSPSGDRLLVGSADGKARVWDVETGLLIHTLDSGAGMVNSVAWSPDGRRLALGTSVIRLFEPEDGFLISELDGPRAPVLAMAYTPMGDILVTASADRLVRTWNTDTNTEMSAIGGFTGRPDSLSITPEGRYVAACSHGDQGASLIDVEGESLSKKFSVPGLEVMSVSFSPDGQLLATGLVDGTTLFWKN